jgi:hypothetical protein
MALSPEEDCWKWLPGEEGEFSVKSSYKILMEEFTPEDEVEENFLNVLCHIWKSPAPSKVVAFSWQFLYDRIPTRSNLDARGIGVSDMPWECLGFVGRPETSNHLLLHCPSAMKVWSEIFKWLDILIVIPPLIASLFEIVKEATRNAKIHRGFLLIWHTTLWSIWKARNRTIFATGS